MPRLVVLALMAACSAANAQTPSTNPMPDGSRDMFVGLGVVAAPRYEGADGRRERALPVFQVQWSNGAFVSGMSAGMHLSSKPSVEYGPLLALQPRRTMSGTGGAIGGMAGQVSIMPAATPGVLTLPDRLLGMDTIEARLQYGGFLNYYLTPQWRATTSLLWGAGNARDGGKLELGVQRIAAALAPHHTLSLTAGVTLVNRSYNRAFFGVTARESSRSVNPSYDPRGGLKDATLGVRWNWSLSPAWMVTSSLAASHLLGDAQNSPLVERPTNMTVSTAIAYRF